MDVPLHKHSRSDIGWCKSHTMQCNMYDENDIASENCELHLIWNEFEVFFLLNKCFGENEKTLEILSFLFVLLRALIVFNTTKTVSFLFVLF